MGRGHEGGVQNAKAWQAFSTAGLILVPSIPGEMHLMVLLGDEEDARGAQESHARA